MSRAHIAQRDRVHNALALHNRSWGIDLRSTGADYRVLAPRLHADLNRGGDAKTHGRFVACDVARARGNHASFSSRMLWGSQSETSLKPRRDRV